jgi:predicted metal-dependent phosphoesterase TrpH
MFVDLHIHTYFSDGTLSPEEVVRIAKEQGLSMISICDHETIAAYEFLPELCAAAGIKLVQGAEIDVYWHEQNMHILAYGFDPANKEIRQLMNESRHELDLISIEMVLKIQEDYPEINPEDYSRYEHKKGNGGWKGINYFKDRGLTENLMDGMNLHSRYGGYKPKFRKMSETCDIIRAAGGYPVLAHPGNWWLDMPSDFDGILTDLLRNGIAGIECYYPSHTEELTKRCVDFCVANDLLITCGGDGHGEFCKIVHDVEYGIGILRVDSSRLNLKGLM